MESILLVDYLTGQEFFSQGNILTLVLFSAMESQNNTRGLKDNFPGTFH